MATARKRSTAKSTETTKASAKARPPQAKGPAPEQQQDRIPEGVPHLYADLVLDAVYGIHTTKLVLGVETGNGLTGLRPVGVVVIPTAVLLDMSRRLVNDLTQPGIAQEAAQRYANILRSMQPEAPEKAG